MAFKELFESAMTGKSGDVIVVHTSLSYNPPKATLVTKSEFKTYFSENRGFESDDLKKVKSLATGQHIGLGIMNPDEVVVIKL